MYDKYFSILNIFNFESSVGYKGHLTFKPSLTKGLNGQSHITAVVSWTSKFSDKTAGIITVYSFSEMKSKTDL